MNLLHRLLPWLLVPMCTGTLAATQEFRLENGMKVLVKEDHRAPIVTSQVWYKVGSSYEHDGMTGISHVLEHLMFKGTERYPAGEFSRIVAREGGEENAFTGRDYTAYYQTLANDRLPVALELESDRMRNLLLQESEFLKEVEVVKEERRLRTEDQPNAQVSEQFNAAAFMVSPYRHPVIGWMDDLNSMQIGDLRRWYRAWYAPNNATLVVVGDVDPAAVHRLAQRYFGDIKVEELEPVKSRQEPIQYGEKRIRVRVPARQPYLMMGYKTPVLAAMPESWEPYALEVLSALMSTGDSSRLQRNLVRGAEVAAAVDSDYSLFNRLPELWSVDAIPAPGQSMEKLEAAIQRELEQLRSELVPEDELDRVRKQVIANQVYQQDSVFYQAMLIGMLETVGLDWRLLEQYPARIAAVTPEQVREVARRYLKSDQLTVAVLEPLPMDAKTAGRTQAPATHHH